MICPKCNHTNPQGAQFCKNCGTKIQSQQTQSYSPSNKTQIAQAPVDIRYNNADVLIGRSSSCDVIIDDPGVSSKHARIFIEDEKAFIEDLRSLNGTIVNGRKINSKTPISLNDKVFLGNRQLNINDARINDILIRYGINDYSYSSNTGTLQLKMNTRWLGKLFYFVLTILMFFPWLTVKTVGDSVTFTAVDFAFNKLPTGVTLKTSIDYGPLHTVFLIVFLGLIAGILLNFIKFKISNKFNYVNLLSVILFVIVVGYLSFMSSVESLFGFAAVVLQHNISSYLFTIILLGSVFEGLIEYNLSERT